MSRFVSNYALMLAALCAAVSAQSFQPLQAPLGISGLPHSSGTGHGSGVCLADFDGDGDVDVVLPQSFGLPFLYFRNDGGMQFADISANCGLGVCAQVRCVNAADIDNDGDADLYVGNHNTVVQLFINNGSGIFTEEAAARGLLHDDSNYAAAFGDYDRDGWLDLYVGQRTSSLTGFPEPNLLYRNLGGGVFQDVTVAAGVSQTSPTLVVAFMDYNEDFWPDIMVVNDKGNTYGPNQLFRNNGDGTFTDVSVQTGTNIPIDGMGLDFLDVFNDGGLDFYCSDLPFDHLFQLWDPVAGAYIDATATYGLEGGGIGWAVNWLDYDNDGWQDLQVVHMDSPNLMFRNPAQPASMNVQWTDQAPALGLDVPYRQFTVGVADFDDDGRMDLLQRYHAGVVATLAPDGVTMYRNEVVVGTWLKFRARGTVSNRDGLGARIEVLAGSHLQRQWVRNGVGFLSSSDSRVHFGMGTATVADLVTVTWPSGQVQHLTDVPTNQIVEIVEPQLSLSAPAQVGASTTLDMSIPGDGGLDYLMVLAFAQSPTTLMPDGNILPIAVGSLTALTLIPGNVILPGSVGVLDASGQTSSALNIPPLPFLSGLTIYGTGLTIDTVNFQLLRTVFPTALPITIQ